MGNALHVPFNSDIRTLSTRNIGSSSTAAARLRALVDAAYGGKAAAFARATGLSSGAVSEYLSGKVEPSFERIARIIERTPVAAAWLLTGQEPMLRGAAAPAASPDIVYLPRMDVEASAGEGAEISAERVEEYRPFKREELTRLSSHPGRLVIIQVRGDSMFPTLSPGDELVIDMEPDQTLVDAVYAVRIDDTLMVKRINHRPGNRLLISSDNPAYDPFEVDATVEERFHIVGRVVWAGKRF